MRVRVDEARCQGHTVCAMNAPEIFDVSSEDGHARVVSDVVPAGKEDIVRMAAAGCPEQAVVVED